MSTYGRMLAESNSERDARVAREQRNRLLGLAAMFATAGFVCAVAGFLGGYRYGIEEQKRIEAEKPKRTTPQPAPTMQLSRRECVERCIVRDRMERVK